MENRINIKIRNERSKRVQCSLRIFHDNTKDDHSYTKGGQSPQRLHVRRGKRFADILGRCRFLCAAAKKKYDYTIGHGNTAVSRLCAEHRLQSKNADKDTDCILISVLIWRRVWDSNPREVALKRFSRPPRYDRFDNPPGMDVHLVFQSAFVILSHKYSFVKALCLYVCRFMQKYNTYRPEMKKQIS